MEYGDGGDANVHVSILEADPHPPVLRAATLREVQTADYAQARENGCSKLGRGWLYILEDTIDAVADPKSFGVVFNVDVRGARLECVDEEVVHRNHGRDAPLALSAIFDDERRGLTRLRPS